MDVVHLCPRQPDRRYVLVLSDATLRFLAERSGREPQDLGLWEEALTHASTADRRNYERLEFLGDRVLGLSIAEWLFERGDEPEGKLSQRLNALVSRATCAQIARGIDLAAHIRLGKQARDDGGQDSDNILGDVMEALIGARFLESGFEAARDMVRGLWEEAFMGKTGKRKHPKSALQEWAAGNRRRMPEYKLLDRSGPDHAARFTVAVQVHGIGEAQATSNSKQDAETLAAEEFMRRFG
jgi:ribonuclease-3